MSADIEVIDPNEPPAVADQLGVTDDWLIGQLKDIVEDALRGTPQFDRDGNDLGLIPNHTAALRGIELLMRHKGIHAAPKDADSGDVQAVQIVIQGIDPTQLI